MMETRGGSGGVVVCLGVGGMADLGTILGLEPDEEVEGGEGLETQAYGGVEVWLIDSHRPWNLGNVFGGFPLEPKTEEAKTFAARSPPGVNGGRIEQSYRHGKGGIIVFDDGDIEDELGKEREAYLALVDMPEVEDDGEDLGDSDEDNEEDDDGNDSETGGEPPTLPAPPAGKKRKSWDFEEDDDESDDEDRPRQRRRSNSVWPVNSFYLNNGH